MGDTLHKMQVIIETTTEPLKKGMENSRREVKKSVEEIQKETENKESVQGDRKQGTAAGKEYPE